MPRTSALAATRTTPAKTPRTTFVAMLCVSDIALARQIQEACQDIGGGVIFASTHETSTLPDILICAQVDNQGLLLREHMPQGVVPIVGASGCPQEITPYDAREGEGNGFVYNKQTVYSIFAEVVKYLENKKFPSDRHAIKKNAIATYGG
jgi:hypothetical protein